MFAMLMKWMQANKILPQISDTERQALEAGTVWVDGEFFGGNPDFKKMLAEAYNRLPPEEQAFLDGPTEELCRMIDREEIARTHVIPEPIVEFIKKHGFMGMNVPKEYGGLDFSTLGKSSVMAKLSPYSVTVGTLVVIPNSLGAAELIVHYGTQAQKDHYLPRLARGEYVPCFGLTEPTAGSDAASIKAEGLVFKDSDGQVKLKLNFRKRYITLAPIANLCSIACTLHDPDNLLGKGEHPGITVVLVHKGTPGFSNGDHHEPIGEAFYNGPLIGKDVVVPVDNIIGGPTYAGLGWKMLMEQLAGGRAVSLPAGAVGGMKAAMAATGAYSMVRQQFGIPIGRMEGVEEKVGKVAALTYLSEAARVYSCSAVDSGQQPPVVSAILKAYTTELARELAIDAMDVFSGAGVMQGPNNIVGRGYTAAPVAITVEGANIMTRTLMIFGQGATRCHPYALNVVKGVEENDVAKFRRNLLGWLGHVVMGLLRTTVRGLTRGWTVSVPVSGPTAKYYRRLGWAAARFGFLTDMAMFTIGGKLKARGKLTGRYADAVAWMFLGFSALRRFEAEGRRSEDLPLVHYSVQYALAQVQKAFEGIYANFDAPLLGGLMRSVGALWLRLNPVGTLPGDAESRAAALTIQSYNAQFQRLSEGVFAPAEHTVGAGRLLKAFRLVTEAQPVLDKIAAAQRSRSLPKGAADSLADVAQAKGVITAEEARLVKSALAARLEAIEVDVFTKEQFFGIEAEPLPERRVANA
ncbi:MAG TPA: acyl-CoA dehydrogenase [Nevskiales bacterium]|nr:acyl-CoA dehydrogenase [Nevskiales bacterium]